MPFPALVRWRRCGALLAALVGLATLRISGVYFVIFTLGLAELVRQIVAWAQHIMGSSSGLYVLTGITDRDLLAAARPGRAGVPDRLVIGRSRLGFALRIIGNDEVVAVAQRHQHGARQGRAVHDLGHLRVDHRRAGGAALDLHRAVDRVQRVLSFQVVIMALLGGCTACGGRWSASSRSPCCGIIAAGFPPDHAAARRLLPAHRLSDSERRGRADRGPRARRLRRAGTRRNAGTAMPRRHPALSVDGVSKRFGGLVAVDAMSFELARTRCWG